MGSTNWRCSSCQYASRSSRIRKSALCVDSCDDRGGCGCIRPLRQERSRSRCSKGNASECSSSSHRLAFPSHRRGRTRVLSLDSSQSTPPFSRFVFDDFGQIPFAEDVRSYKFASLTNYFNVKGGRIESHPYLPTEEHVRAMDDFVDGMDLMDAAEDDNG